MTDEAPKWRKKTPNAFVSSRVSSPHNRSIPIISTTSSSPVSKSPAPLPPNFEPYITPHEKTEKTRDSARVHAFIRPLTAKENFRWVLGIKRICFLLSLCIRLLPFFCLCLPFIFRIGSDDISGIRRIELVTIPPSTRYGRVAQWEHGPWWKQWSWNGAPLDVEPFVHHL